MLKRPLAFTAIVFSLGVLIAALRVDLGIVAVSAFILCAFIFVKTGKTSVCILIAAGVFLGILRMNMAQLYRDSIVSEYAETTAVRELTVTEFSQQNKVIASFKDKNHKYKVYLTVKEGAELFPGDIVEGEITLRKPFSSKNEFSGFSQYLAGRGVYLTAYANKLTLKGKETDFIMAKVYCLRSFMDELGKKCFSGNTRALFNAMVFGDKRLISDELSEALRASGLNHITVVSGMHLSVIITAVMVFIHKIFGRGRKGYLFALLTAIFICLATGAGASVVRALIMCSLFFISQLFYRESDSLTSLAFAVFVMTVINPFIVFNQGFTLSVLSVLGILLYNRKISGFMEKYIPRSVARSLSLSISAQLTVTPALVYYFGIITPYCLISNLLLVALSGVYVVVGIIFILFSWAEPLSLFVGHSIELISRVIEEVCFYISALPHATIKITTPHGIFLTVWVFILVIIYSYPLDLKRQLRVSTAFMLAIISITAFNAKNTMNIQTIAYGQNTMTLVTLSSNETIMIDCPDIYDAQQLEDCEYVIISSDSFGELFEGKSPIKTAIAPKELFTDKTKKELLRKAEELGIKVIFAEESEKICAGRGVAKYIPIDKIDGGYAVELQYGGKTLISLQGLSGADILKLYKEEVCFSCDYLILPYMAFPEDADIQKLSTGKAVIYSK